MNDLGTLLAWSALQATLLALAAAAVYPFAARRRPAAGAVVAAAALGGSVVLTLLAPCPLPSWWDWRAPAPAAPQAARVDPPTAADPPPVAAADAPAASADGPFWPVDLARLSRDGAGRAAAPFADRSQSGWAIAAMVFLAGAAFGLLRLGGGLWAVRDLRRRGRLVLDEPVLRLMQRLREEIGCRGPVELRECPGLGAPAAAGWLRPVVFLPADWRDWTDAELRAALAHELAHVRRCDYLLGLLARLGLALHFYHPLLYWLAGRLRLQQELAADGLAAPPAGGRDAYLRGLARLALRLSDRRPAGWPANPLFSRGMLMRRIQMLRTKDGGFGSPAPRWGRAAVVVLLAGAVVAVAALRCPAQKAGPGAPPSCAVGFVDDGTIGGKEADPDSKGDRPEAPVCIPCQPTSSACYAALFQKTLDVVKDAGFDVDYSNRYDGRIESSPLVAPRAGRRRKASAPAIRRRAIVIIVAQGDDHFSIDVKVFKERAIDSSGTEWTPIGRDLRMEQSMKEQLVRFDPTREAPPRQPDGAPGPG